MVALGDHVTPWARCALRLRAPIGLFLAAAKGKCTTRATWASLTARLCMLDDCPCMRGTQSVLHVETAWPQVPHTTPCLVSDISLQQARADRRLAQVTCSPPEPFGPRPSRASWRGAAPIASCGTQRPPARTAPRPPTAASGWAPCSAGSARAAPYAPPP